jgi:hypothetical protein
MRRLFHAALCAAFVVAHASAQECGPWSVLGRFDFEFAKKSIREATPVEKLLEEMVPGKAGPDLSVTYKGMGGATVQWSAVNTDKPASALDAGLLDLNKLAPPPPGKNGDVGNALCYLYRRIDAPSDMQLAVSMGSDDGLRLWLNGELLVDAGAARALVANDNFVVFKLHAGTNHLLAKITQAGGPYSFRMAAWSKIPQSAINDAIDRGVEFLIQNQLADGSWGYDEAFGGGHAAFTAYTLLKCGVRRDHPAVRMALANTEHRAMDTTYATSALIMALEATGDASLHDRLAEAFHQLLAWQDSTGLYSYPIYPGGDRPPVDLSNTMFAALALRAAAHAGFKAPDTTWKNLATGTLRCMEHEHDVEMLGGGPGGEHTSPGGKRTVAGFSYRFNEGVTGAITSAGVSLLAIADEQTEGRLPPALRSRMTQAKQWGLDWLGHSICWSQNPGAGTGHHMFYVYGLERVGALLDVEKIGDVNWYWDGAAYLIQAQGGNGAWNVEGYADEEYIDTLLALLFLKKATVRSTGETVKAGMVETKESGADVSLRATGDSPLTLWVTNLRDGIVDQVAGEGGALEVERIDYFAHFEGDPGEPALIATVKGGIAKRNELARFALRHQFDKRGTWRVFARISLLLPLDPNNKSGARASREFDSPQLEVRIDGVIDPSRLEYPADRGRDLLFGAPVKVEASSSYDDPQSAPKTIDGTLHTRWFSGLDDEHPWIRFTAERPIKADRVLFSHALPRLSQAHTARPIKVDVIVNGKEHFAGDLDPDVMAKTTVAFGAVLAVRQIEVRILECRDRVLGKNGVGFSEIELERGH